MDLKELKENFNAEQYKAILTDINQDVTITAGAGSGKTNTLTEKVSYLISEGKIKPSELLILTFTNNAAHEMKTRIIDKFKDKPEFAKQILSAHVQTFDSFFQYLVSTYSGTLGISDSLTIVSEDVIKAKQNTYLDQILEEEYENNRDLAIKTLQKFNIRDDFKTKQVIMDIEKQLSGFIPETKEKFLQNYDETFLNRKSFELILHKYLEERKLDIKNELLKARFLEQHKEELENEDISLIESVFNNPHAFQYDAMNLVFEDDDASEIYEGIKNILILNDEAFIKAIKEFPIKYKDSIGKRKNNKTSNAYAFAEIKKFFATDKATFGDLLLLDDTFDENYSKLVYFKDDIKWILSIVKKLETKITNFKRATNSFDFNDIGLMAYQLLTDEKYKTTADEIRARFKYIMVDEYQDTNDIQETILNSLTKDNSAHIFCVGDAKQSIYKFRNANVEIIRNRQKSYETSGDPNKIVIPMNKNYRSGPQLLEDINYVFNFYMKLSHGSIDYITPSEQLMYDSEVNLYGKPYDHFGIYRLMPTPGSKVFDNVRWEALAIVNDIKNKVANGFEVYDRKNKGPRTCNYSDFCIIMRTKKESRTYMEIFSQYNIPLNVIMETNLLEIDTIILIQSLISLISFKVFGNEVDVKHLYASIARSYIYQLSDKQIHNDLLGNIDDLENTQIMKDLNEFCLQNSNKSLNEIFANMINYFHIIDKLYLIGNVEDNISKIEMLQSIILAQESVGDTLVDFINLLDTISSYDLDLGAKTSSSIDNAVDLMTIHASKGLERKVVYMPCSCNKLSGGNNAELPDYTFSKDFGILLPYYNFDPNDLVESDDGEETPKPVQVSNALNIILKEQKKNQNPDVDEHVRYFYVALTRAEGALYIVGQSPEFDSSAESKAINEERLYGMLFSTPYYPYINESYLEKMINRGWASADEHRRFLRAIEILKNPKAPLNQTSFLNESYFDNYEFLWNEKILDKARNIAKKYIDDTRIAIYDMYIINNVGPNCNDLDLLARIYSNKTFGVDIKSYDELNCEIDNLIQSIPESSLFSFSNRQDFYTKKKGELNDFLIKFGKHLIDNDFEYFEVQITKDSIKEHKENGAKYAMSKDFLEILAFIFDDTKEITKTLFAYERFNTNVEYFDSTTISESKNNTLPELSSYNISNKEFNFEIRQYSRASKLSVNDEEKPAKEILDRGTYLHRMMELVDFNTKDTSFIKNEFDRRLIDKILTNDILSNLKDAKIFKEYGYFDEDLNTTGYIDLFYIKDDEYYIIDYKSKHVVDDDYENQLRTYQRNIQRIFNINNASKIHMYLLSISDNKVLEVKPNY